MQTQLRSLPVQSVQRLKRTNQIRLISIDEDSYKVYGSTGKIYTIHLNPSINCNCIDFKKNKGAYCKHIYFIFLRLYKFIPDRMYTSEECQEFHKCINCSQEEPRNEECSICFEDLKNIFLCKTCKHGFHNSCIHEMMKVSKKNCCPMCRSDLFNVDDLIQQVQRL
jgi:hypothetical protein